MGSDDHEPEEAPAHVVEVGPFVIARHQVTNRQFARFVAATGYVTVAERPLDPADFPSAPIENLVPGSLVFTPTPGPVDLRHLSQWWTWTPGACWHHPEGPPARSATGSTIRSSTSPTRMRSSFADLGRCGPPHRGAVGVRGPWRSRGRSVHLGERATPRGPSDGQHLGRARLPMAEHGRVRLVAHLAGRLVPPQRVRPVRHGRQRVGVDRRLVDRPPPGVVGDLLLRRSERRPPRATRGATRPAASIPIQPQFATPRKVVKGGSHLCADTYCLRYRPAARRPQTIDTGMSHVGFRCAWPAGGTAPRGEVARAARSVPRSGQTV
jgi:formylglycine-generating enzyme